MNKVTAMVIAMAVAVAIFGSAMYGWSQASPPGQPAQIDVKAFRQFQKETLPLRDELMAKRLELRNEYAQPTPNYDRIATLQKEMIDLRTKIQVAAQKQGLPPMGRGWMAGKDGFGRGGWCQGPGAGWGRGPGGGRGHGGGWGYGNVNCPMWK